MSIERGFRHITGAVSVAFFVAGLGLTAYIVYRGTSFLSARIIYKNCVREAGYDLWIPGLTSEELKRVIYAGEQKGVFVKCSTIASFPEEAPPNVIYDFWGPSWRDWSIAKFVLLTGGVGVLLSAAAAALTWGVFYLFGWIIRGFQDTPE